jgi:hypothetical protein
LRRAIAAHLTSRDVARVIYGAVIGLALVVALEAHPPTAGEAAAAVLGAAAAVGFAEIYSELLATETRSRRVPGAPQVRAVVTDAAAVVFGAAFPAIFFVLAALDVIGLSTAFTLSKWTGLGLLCAYGFAAGRMSGSGVGGAVLHAAAVGAIGGVLILLKALVH